MVDALRKLPSKDSSIDVLYLNVRHFILCPRLQKTWNQP